MTITVITHLAESNDLSAFRSLAEPLFKKHGVIDMRIGFCYAGEHAHQRVVVQTYTDWAAYGAAMQAIFDDPEFQELFKGVYGDVRGRSLFVLEEV